MGCVIGLRAADRVSGEVLGGGTVDFHRRANEVALVLLTLLVVGVVTGTWLFMYGDVLNGYNGCGEDLGRYVARGLVAWCATVDSGLVVGVWDAEWLLATNLERLDVVSSLESVVRGKRKLSYGLVQGDPSGETYWARSQRGKKGVAGISRRAVSSAFEAEASKTVIKMFFLSAVVAGCWLCVVLWVFFDASWRGMRKVVWWVFFVVMVPIGGVGVYFLCRPKVHH